ncbi:MAG: hypothetical protein GF307_06950 [candidate division Zixibacteria bacterium]|nr:hypothetical protein [candidate division Zixibacteria bacterium]
MTRLLLILLFICFPAVSAYAQRSPDNLEFTSLVMDAAVVETFNELNVSGKSFRLRSAENNQLNYILEQSLINFIKEHNGIVYVEREENPDDSIQLDFTLEYRIVDYEMTYAKAPKPYPKGKNIWRESRIIAIFRLLSEDGGRIHLSEEVNRTVGDNITRKEAKQFSHARSPLMSPQLPEGGIKRYLEPAVVGSTIAVLVYLFFSNR